MSQQTKTRSTDTTVTPVPQSLRPSKAELLMPAGSLEKLKMAVLYGADAVYLGTPDMSLRTISSFSLEDVLEGVRFAHAHGVRVYLTLNLFSHNKDIPKLEKYIETVRTVKPDGLIIADPGVFSYVKAQAPELELHISTQANVCSWISVDFWQKAGAKLCVLAREVTYEELTEIREKCPDIKLEAFVHGAMCMTYSGRCLLSNYMAERGANQGSCANSCRWKYKVHMKLKDGTLKELNLSEENLDLFEFFLEEGYREGELMPLEEDERGSYILNAKDLCLLPKLDDYLRIGVDSLKVEGRGRSAYYAAIVARAYRMAIDDWYENPEDWDPKKYMDEVLTVPNRGYSYAFHEGRLTNHAHNYEDTYTMAEWEYAGVIESVTEDSFLIRVKNKIDAGDVIEFVSPLSRKTLLIRLYNFDLVKETTGKKENAIEKDVFKTVETVHAGTKPVIQVPFSLFEQEDQEFVKTAFPAFTVLRKERALSDWQWDRLKLDRISLGLEEGTRKPKIYAKQLEVLQESVDEKNTKERRFKTPRLGTAGCCGRGCNGCMVFWHDDAYASARDTLKTQNEGALLEKNKWRVSTRIERLETEENVPPQT